MDQHLCGGEPREGAGNDQHGGAERGGAQDHPQRVPHSEGADGEGAGVPSQT